jgi:modulator of FtsH protease HflK
MNKQQLEEHVHDHAHDHAHGHVHDHSHDHDHGADPFHPQLGAPIDTSELDPANRSLAEALRLSFNILKIVMIVLIVFFAFSGAFKVNEGEVAMLLRFGKLQPTIIKPGAAVAWPRPIDQVIRIPTSIDQVNIEEAFWFEVRPEDRNKTLDQLGPKTQLQPGTDGSLITGDRNIVHGKWSISYQINQDEADLFVRNVAASPERRQMQERARERVRHAAERAIVHVVATVPAEQFIRGQELSAEIKQLTQEKLDELESGITIMMVATSQAIPPLSVRGEFDAVTRAFSEQATRQEEAQREAEKILSDAAGPAHKALALAIDYYETARRDDNAADADKGLKAINDLLEGVRVSEALAPLQGDARADQARLRMIAGDATLGGEASKMLSEARSYARSAEVEVQAEADRFNRLVTQYGGVDAKQIYLARRWYELLSQILKTDVRVEVQPPGVERVMDINPDPRWQRYLEEKKHRAEQELEKQRRDLTRQGR